MYHHHRASDRYETQSVLVPYPVSSALTIISGVLARRQVPYRPAFHSSTWQGRERKNSSANLILHTHTRPTVNTRISCVYPYPVFTQYSTHTHSGSVVVCFTNCGWVPSKQLQWQLQDNIVLLDFSTISVKCSLVLDSCHGHNTCCHRSYFLGPEIQDIIQGSSSDRSSEVAVVLVSTFSFLPFPRRTVHKISLKIPTFNSFFCNKT